LLDRNTDVVSIEVGIVCQYMPGQQRDTCRKLFEFYRECSKMLFTLDALDVTAFGISIEECVDQMPEPYRTGCMDLHTATGAMARSNGWRVKIEHMRCLPCDLNSYEQSSKFVEKYRLR